MKPIQQKQVDFFNSALDAQFRIAGYDKTHKYCFEDRDWFEKFTITVEQEKEFKKWFLKEYRRVFGISGKREYPWFYLSYGLKTYDNL